MMKKSTAYLDYSLEVTCPHCGKEIDLVKYEDDAGDNDISKRIFSDNWDALIGWGIECPHCNNDFLLSHVEY